MYQNPSVLRKAKTQSDYEYSPWRKAYTVPDGGSYRLRKSEVRILEERKGEFVVLADRDECPRRVEALIDVILDIELRKWT